jgi:cytochrome b6-f complex iron-sulfur subunit
MQTLRDKELMHTSIEQSERFKPPRTRRDFLGLAAAWSTVVAFVMAMVGALRLPMPSVFPESDSKVNLGRPDQFAVGSATYFPVPHLWLFRSDEGFNAISAVCTHLGCITQRETDGTFECPCHGSRFGPMGRVLGGPAPKGLIWAELTLSPEGGLIADTLKETPAGTIFAV